MAWDRLTSFITGGAVSRSLGPSLDAQFEPARQNAWMRRRYRVLRMAEAAQARARYARYNLDFRSTSRAPGGAASSSWGATAVLLDDDAAREGFSPERYNLLTRMAQRVPGGATALTLLRRRLIDGETFEAIHKHEGIAPGLLHALRGLEFDPLDPDQVANAVQQGFLPNPGILPDAETGGPPYTPPVEEVRLDPFEVAAMGGTDSDELRVLTQLSGNPPGPMQLLDMWNRGLITEEGVDRGIREGRTKTKWTPPLKLLRWNVLTGTQVVNLWLRGWITRADGQPFDPSFPVEDELQLLFQGQGRPLSWHQTWIGLKRGGTYDGPLTGIDPAFLASLRQSNIRPEWYNLAWAQRYSYPSAFVMRALVQSGVISQADGEADLVDMGWRPDRAKQVTEAWAGVSADTGGGKFTAKAQTQLWTTTHRSFISGESTTTQTRAKLGQAGVPVAERDAVIATWANERELIRKQLTAAQVKKAYVKAVKNQTTGQPWTRDDALAALVERGYSLNDANEYLDI